MKLPMSELLVAHGADVNALSCGGTYPIILAPFDMSLSDGSNNFPRQVPPAGIPELGGE